MGANIVHHHLDLLLAVTDCRSEATVISHQLMADHFSVHMTLL